MNATQALAPGLPDGVHDSQQAFRAALDALARPGQCATLARPYRCRIGGCAGPAAAEPGDDETPVWWQYADAGQQQWLRFHTGAPLAEFAASRKFAVFTDNSQDIVLSDFASGTAEAPEYSATLLVELPGLTDGPTLAWRGPGIADLQSVGLQGLPDDFWSQWQANHAAFPQGWTSSVLTSIDLSGRGILCYDVEIVQEKIGGSTRCVSGVLRIRRSKLRNDPAYPQAGRRRPASHSGSGLQVVCQGFGSGDEDHDRITACPRQRECFSASHTGSRHPRRAMCPADTGDFTRRPCSARIQSRWPFAGVDGRGEAARRRSGRREDR